MRGSFNFTQKIGLGISQFEEIYPRTNGIEASLKQFKSQKVEKPALKKLCDMLLIINSLSHFLLKKMPEQGLVLDVKIIILRIGILVVLTPMIIRIRTIKKHQL